MRAIRIVESALGSGAKVPVAAERRGCPRRAAEPLLAADLPAGQAVADDDVEALRPATGLSPDRLSRLVGRATARAVAAGALVRPDDVEPEA